MRLPYLFAAVAAALSAGAAHADVCFTVLDSGGRVLHQSRRAPVDMSRPISETLYSRFPQASLMVFGADNGVCEELRGDRQPTPSASRPLARRF